jgi:F-type H+-transporting ATPase subunit epsilon
MRVAVISPDSAVFDGEADSVIAPAHDGQVGILANHAPMMTLLGTGLLQVRQADVTHRFTVSGGFLQVVDNVVRVVAERIQAQP